ncbi:Protein of unknown function DUF241, plant [Cynara cardunculus var. scolymus]|uniref:Uncharacterized protein n=1 Tax=Cynara cardunculus var. scolymus TaxID=59895 RepID=A0A103Y5L1_CYNCS|nr:Protein of unknown function DUF241, plant [Cynara cardunculus var. scolymus]
MIVSLKFNKFQKKSISLPCRSHPSTVRIEEELSLIKASSSATPSVDNICHGLSQLVELHHFTDGLLVLPVTQNLISLHRNTMWVGEVMEVSMKLLDICSIIRDVVLQMEEHVRDLQSALRRRKDHTSIQVSIANYIDFRKKTKKDAKELITKLKQSEKVMGLVADPDNHHLPAVIRVLMEVTEVTVSIFESLLMYVSPPVLKLNGWSLVVWKLRHKGTVACKEDEKHKRILNELEAVDVSLLNIRNGGQQTPEIMQMAQHRLEEMQARMRRLESGLEGIFRESSFDLTIEGVVEGVVEGFSPAK